MDDVWSALNFMRGRRRAVARVRTIDGGQISVQVGKPGELEALIRVLRSPCPDRDVLNALAACLEDKGAGPMRFLLFHRNTAGGRPKYIQELAVAEAVNAAREAGHSPTQAVKAAAITLDCSESAINNVLAP